MQIENVSGWRPLGISLDPQLQMPAVPVAPAGPAATDLKKTDFSSWMIQSLQSLNSDQTQARQQVESFLRGEGPALHTVMLNIEQASLGVEFAVQVRNKVLDVYNELMRMQF